MPSPPHVNIGPEQGPARPGSPRDGFPAKGDAPTGLSPMGRSGDRSDEWVGGAFGPSRGILVVGHGTADQTGADETRQIARLVAALLPGVPVELGFLEVIGPSIAESLLRLAARGCREVVAAPLLLFKAGHARQDVPAAVRDGARAAGVSCRQSDPLGCHEKIVALSRRRRREALALLAPSAPESTVLVMVGRGSSDPGAHGQLEEFTAATLHSERESRPGRVELGFVAAARPTLAEAVAHAAGGSVLHARHDEKSALESLRRDGVRRIILQPHLLFSGHVQEQVSAAAAAGRATHPEIEWVQVERLGPDPLVAEALVERAAEAVGEGPGRAAEWTISPETT